jgi:tetratricopeptide (TPR) repeat protein
MKEVAYALLLAVFTSQPTLCSTPRCCERTTVSQQQELGATAITRNDVPQMLKAGLPVDIVRANDSLVHSQAAANIERWPPACVGKPCGANMLTASADYSLALDQQEDQETRQPATFGKEPEIELVSDGPDPILRFRVIHFHFFLGCGGYLYVSRDSIRYEVTNPEKDKSHSFTYPRSQIKEVSEHSQGMGIKRFDLTMRDGTTYRMAHVIKKVLENNPGILGRDSFLSPKIIEQALNDFDSTVAVARGTVGSTEVSVVEPNKQVHRLPNSVAVRQLPTSPASGLYSLDALVGFDTLDGVSYNAAQGTLSLFGHRTRNDGGAEVHYLDLLAAALDSDKPVFSLEWTASSERQVDRALAYYADDRNNEDLTTRLSKIFDANGLLNRQGASFFRALGVDVREGMNRYEFNASLLAASGHKNAGTALRAFGSMGEAIKHNDKATRNSSFEDLVNALGLNNFVAENAARYRHNEITDVQLMDLVFPRLLSGLANTFGWDDAPYVDKYWRLRRSGHSYVEAGDEALLDLQRDLNTLPRKAFDTITANVSEIVIPPDVMREVLGVEPRVRPVLTGLPDRTRLALTACEADVFSKSLFDMPGLQSKVPRYRGYFAWLRDRGQNPVTGEGHLWTTPGDFELLESTDGRTLRFGRTPMRFHIERYESGRRSVANPQLSAYADLLTAIYDDIAREYPVLHQLRESTKIVAVAQWLKQRGYAVSLPRAGRESVSLPAELPGVIYMVMAVKHGPVGEILTAAGGIDFSGESGWRYTPRDTPSPKTDLVDRTARQIRERLEQTSNRKIEVPAPQPIAEVKTEEVSGQKVTTLTVAIGASAEGSTPAVQSQHSPEQNAMLLWKTEDLAGAEENLRKLIESSAGDMRHAAYLRAWLAQVLHEKGDDAGAIKELNEAARLAPDLLIFKLLAAKSMVESGDLAGAETALRKYLDLDPTNQAAARWLTDMQARQEGGTGAASLGLSAFPKALEAVRGQNALDQAYTTQGNTTRGLQSETPEGRTTGKNEDASGASRQVFDSPTPLKSSGINPAADLRNVGNAPSVRELTSHIPKDSLSDPTIKTSVDWYQRRESDKADTLAKIAEVQKNIDSHSGDPTILNTKKSQLANEIKQIERDQQTAQDSIKLNLGMKWIESPSEAGGKEKAQ